MRGKKAKFLRRIAAAEKRQGAVQDEKKRSRQLKKAYVEKAPIESVFIVENKFKKNV